VPSHTFVNSTPSRLGVLQLTGNSQLASVHTVWAMSAFPRMSMSSSSKYCVLAETQIFALKTREGAYLPQSICKYMGFADGRPSMMHGATAHTVHVY